MNTENTPSTWWSALWYLFLLALAIMFFSCSDNSTESDTPADTEMYETRVVYQKSGSSDLNYYYVNLNGSSDLLCDVTKFEGILDNPSWITFNPLLGKVMYYDEGARTITISDYDGGNSVPVKLGGAGILDSLQEYISKVVLHYSSTGAWALCEVNTRYAYKIDTAGNAKEIIIPKASDWTPKIAENVVPRLSFTEDGNWFAFGIGYYLAVRDTTGELVKLCSGYDSHDVKITPKGEKIFFANSDASYGKDLFYIELSSDAEMNVTPDSLDVTDFSISPDGKYVIYSAYNRANKYALYLYDIANAETRVVVDDNGYNRNPLFISTDQIVWQSGEFVISVMKIDGSGKREVLANANLAGAGYFKVR